LVQLLARSEAIGHSGLYAGLLGLLGGQEADAPRLRSWLLAWQAAYNAIAPLDRPARLHTDRCFYYRRAMDQYVEGEHPQNALWPLLRTWTDIVLLLPAENPARQDWEAALNQLGLLGTALSA
jgi:hypothetical protein